MASFSIMAAMAGTFSTDSPLWLQFGMMELVGRESCVQLLYDHLQHCISAEINISPEDYDYVADIFEEDEPDLLVALVARIAQSEVPDLQLFEETPVTSNAHDAAHAC